MHKFAGFIIISVALVSLSGCADINRKSQAERFDAYRQSDSYRNYVTEKARRAMPEELRDKKNCMLIKKETGLAVVYPPTFPHVEGMIPTQEKDPVIGTWVEKQYLQLSCLDKAYGVEVAAGAVPGQRPLLLFRYTKGVNPKYAHQWSDAEAKYWFEKLGRNMPKEYRRK